MIIVRATLNVLPEKQLEVRQTLLSMISPVEGEPGCINYCASCDLGNENRFILVGEWESPRYFNHHVRSFIFGVLLGTKPLLSEPIKLQIHTVSRTRGIEFIHAARNG